MLVPSNLPEHGKEIFERTMETLKGKTNPRTKKPYTDEERGKIAWSAVKNKYKRKEEGWELKSLPSFDFETCFNSEPLEFKSENGNYYFSGYLSTFDKDLTNDIVTNDCMNDMLEQVKMGMNGIMRSFKGSPDHDVFWMEDQQLRPISKITDAKLDAKGLHITGMFNSNHPDFNWNEIHNGFYDGLSIEYKPTEFSFKYDGESKTRVLNKVQLKGYGHTPRPANPFATLTDVFVKSLDVMDLEDDTKENKLTEEKVDYFMKDELKASKEYEELGLIELANDEKRHYDFFKSLKEDKTKGVDEMTEEKQEVKSQPVPIEVKGCSEKVEKKEVEESEEEKKKKEKEKMEKGKVEEKKSVDDLEEKIREIVKAELKSLTPEKKSLPNIESEQQGKFEEIKSKEPTDLTGYVVRQLGG